MLADVHIRLLELLFREHTDNADEDEAAVGDDVESSSADGVAAEGGEGGEAGGAKPALSFRTLMRSVRLSHENWPEMCRRVCARFIHFKFLHTRTHALTRTRARTCLCTCT